MASRAATSVLGVHRRDDAVAVAVKHDQRQLPARPRRAARAHGSERRSGAARRAVGDAGMYSDRGIEVRIGRGHHRCHRAACRESCDIHAGWVDCVVGS